MRGESHGVNHYYPSLLLTYQADHLRASINWMIDVEYNREKVEEGKRLDCSWIVEEWDQSAWVQFTPKIFKVKRIVISQCYGWIYKVYIQQKIILMDSIFYQKPVKSGKWVLIVSQHNNASISTSSRSCYNWNSNEIYSAFSKAKQSTPN